MKALREHGEVEQPNIFKEFTAGFTQGKASFDWVDVGYGKERADSKIKGRWISSKLQCCD